MTKEHKFAFKYALRVKYGLVCLWLAQGNLEQASRIVQENGITANDDIPYLREMEYLALLRLLLAQGNYDAAMVLSKRLLQKAEAGKRMGRFIEVLILQALIFQGRKDQDQSLAILKKALSLARPERYIRTFLDEGEPMVRLLHLARSRQIEMEYTTELLSLVPKTSGTTPPPPQLLVEPLTSREIEVLKLIEAGDSNQEIAEKLVISFTTVKRHISNIYTKLDAKSRTQAIAIGKELKLFE
jgi:LuxR family maltose regulon positive regulatory protein